MSTVIKNILTIEGLEAEKSRLLSTVANEPFKLDFTKIKPLPPREDPEWCMENWGTRFNAINCEIFMDANPVGPRFSPAVRIEFDSIESVPSKITKKLSEMFPSLEIVHNHIVDTNSAAGICFFEGGKIIDRSISLWEDWRMQKPGNLIHVLNMKYDRARYTEVLRLFLRGSDRNEHYDKCRIKIYEHYLKLAEAQSKPVTLPPTGYQSDAEQFICI